MRGGRIYNRDYTTHKENKIAIDPTVTVDIIIVYIDYQQ